MSALEQLWRLLEDLAALNEENEPLLRVIRDAAGGERRVEMYRNPFYGWLRATVTVFLRRAEADGDASPCLEIEHAVDAVLAPLNIDLYLFQWHELGMKPERIPRALRSLLLDGLRGEGS